jgi:predicted RNA binding protein YcfA (HicA-like mRNA interferase family)
VRFEEMESLLLHLGFTKRQNGTSHAIFTHEQDRSLRLTIPFKKPFIKPIYVKMALQAINKLLEESLD